MDRTQWVNSSGTTVGYPLYDGHGNMVATLAKAATSYSLGDQRAYDAWGVIRQGATSGDPKGRYRANLGHVEDDESGLTYMRARYYEATSGRFLSEDTQGDGFNWYVYCANDGINRVDGSGRDSWYDYAIKGLEAFFRNFSGYFENGDAINEFLARITAAIGLIKTLEKWYKIAESVGTASQAVAELAAIDGAANIASIAQFVNMACRFGKVLLRMSQVLVYYTTVIEAWLFDAECAYNMPY